MKKEEKFIKVKLKDFPVVYNFLSQLWENKKVNKKQTKNYFLYRLNSKRYKMYFIKINNEILGFFSYKIEKDFEYGPLCYVDEIVVLKNIRGKGIGSKIVKFIEKNEKNNCKIIRLHTDKVRKKTRHFYKKKKFDETGVIFEKKLK